MTLRVILYQPQIPQNAGNIVRTCAATGCRLTLVAPLGFSVASRQLRRAGLDYWEDVDLEVVDALPPLLQDDQTSYYLLSSKGERCYHEVEYGPNDTLIFGSETEGLPTSIMHKHRERLLRIPMKATARCLNLSNSVAIVLYEAMRQQNFQGLSQRVHANAPVAAC